VNNLLDVKENDKDALDFAYRLSRGFLVFVSLDLCIRLFFLLRRLVY
jgi:hypothetical protein